MNHYPKTTAELITAINSANSSAGDTIHLVTGAEYILTTSQDSHTEGDSGLPVITSNLTIIGNGATIKRSTTAVDEFRILRVANHTTVEILGLIISDGKLDGTASAVHGAGLKNEGTLILKYCYIINNIGLVGCYGGGILNQAGADLTMDGCIVEGNTSGLVGGLWNSGTATINNTHFHNNYGYGNTGGIWSWSTYTTTITNSAFTGNIGGNGGAIRVSEARLIVESTDFIDNYAENMGGAIRFDSSIISGTLSENRFINNNTGGNQADVGYDYAYVLDGSISSCPIIQANHNYWGATNGPSGEGPGDGDSISQRVSALNWFDTDEPEFEATCECPFNHAADDCASTGNPISLRYGEKRLEATDLSVNTPSGALSFTRSFRQQKTTDSQFQFMGLGWTHNHTFELIFENISPDRTAIVNLPKGGKLFFYEGPANTFTTPAGSSSTFEYDSPNSRYVLTTQDKSVYYFKYTDPHTLMSVTFANGEVLTYTYASDILTQVSDAYGHALNFTYYNLGDFKDDQLLRVTDHTGRYVEFDYVTEKDDGVEIASPKALLSTVTDVRNPSLKWTYNYYGQDGGEDDNDLLNYLIERGLDTDSDGTNEHVLEEIEYQSGNVFEIDVNGDMEVDSGWIDIPHFEPSSNDQVDQLEGEVYVGTYSRYVVTDAADEGIESARFNLLADRTYDIEAWVYLVNSGDQIRMQISDTTQLDDSGNSGGWEKLSISNYTPSSDSMNHRLQFVGRTAADEFYVDSVSIKETNPNWDKIIQKRGIESGNPLEEIEYHFLPNGQGFTFQTTAGKRMTHYFDRGVHAGTEDAAGNRPVQSPNGQFRTKSQEDANGNRTWLNWSADGENLEGVTDALGNVTNFSYDNSNRLVGSVDATGRQTIYGYDADRRAPTLVVVGSEVADPTAQELVSNGDMEDTGDWAGISGQAPATNDRISTQVDGGDYARYVDAASGAGIESTTFDLEANQSYRVQARVFVVSGQVKMAVDSTSDFDATTNGTGVWETLSSSHTPASAATGKHLQFLADGGAAEFYVDSVYIITTGEIDVDGDMESTSGWQAISSATTSQSTTEVDEATYSRSVSAAQDDGIETDSTFTLLAGQRYTIRARVYPVSGVGNETVKMRLVDGSDVEISNTRDLSKQTDIWQTLSNIYEPTTDTTARLQFLAEDGAADFYVDGVSITLMDEPLTHGDMELDSGWSDVNTPTSNIRVPRVDSGEFFRHVVTNGANQGIETDVDLTAGNTYLLMARVLLVSAEAVDVSITDNAAFNASSTTTTDEWQTIRMLATATTGGTKKLQITAANSGADFYVDSVHLIDLGIVSDVTGLRWQEFAYDGRGRTRAEYLIDPDQVLPLQKTTRSYYETGDGAGLLKRLEQYEDATSPTSESVYTDYIYDVLGRVVQTKKSSTFGSCNHNYTVYDEASHVVASICNYEPGTHAAPRTAAEAAALYNSSDPDNNHVTTQVYDALGRRVETTSNAGSDFARSNRTVYDALNRVTRSVSNFVDNNYADPSGWLWVTDHWEDGTSATISHNNSQNIISETRYNQRGLVRLTRDVLGNVTLYGYDDADRLVKTVQNAANASYDNDYTSDPDLSDYLEDTNAADEDIITEQAYDANGNLVKSVDARSVVSFTVYDALNRPKKTVRNAKPEATIDTTAPGYLETNDPRSDNYVISSNPDYDQIDITEYDTLGRVVRTRRLLENRGSGEVWDVSLTGYDTQGRQVKSIQHASQPEYDIASDPDLSEYSESMDADKDVVTTTEYDIQGRVQSTFDVDQIETRMVYDGYNRQIKNVANYSYFGGDSAHLPSYKGDLTDPAQDMISETYYDDDGRVWKTRQVLKTNLAGTDLEWVATLYGYDDLGRQVTVIRNASDPDYDMTSDPDLSGYVVSVNTDEDLVSATVYDAEGRVQQTLDNLGNVTFYGYDSIGRRIKTIQNVSNTSYDIDNDADLSGYTPDVGAGVDEDRITTTSYDLVGRVEEITDAAGNVSRTVYDQLGRRIRSIANYIAQGGTDPSDWVWDAVDNRWEDGAASAINHGMDFDQNLISETTYNKAGQVVQTRDSRGTVTAFSYDNAGWRIITTQAYGTGLETSSYTCFDKAGRVLRTIQNYIPLYDETEQLISPDDWDTNENWVFNPIDHGSYNDENLITEFTYDGASRRISVTNPTGDVTTTGYFKNGQVASMTDGENTETVYRYDAARRRTTVVQNYDDTSDPATWAWNSTNWEV